METAAARGVQIVLALGGAYLLALWFALAVWTFRDIEARSKNIVTQIMSTLLSVLFFVPGTILYLILRPKETLDEAFQRSLEEEYLLQDLEELPVCISCHRWIEDDFVICPHCMTSLRTACSACSRLVNVRWSNCPYCGVDRSEQTAVELERVEAPAARWIARAPRSFRVTRRPAEIPAVYLPVLQPLDTGLEVASISAQETAPIRLFDRRATRAAQNGNSGSNGSSATGEDLAATAVETVDDNSVTRSIR